MEVFDASWAYRIPLSMGKTNPKLCVTIEILGKSKLTRIVSKTHIIEPQMMEDNHRAIIKLNNF